VSGRLLQRLGRQQRCKWKVVAKATGDLVGEKDYCKRLTLAGGERNCFAKAEGDCKKNLWGEGLLHGLWRGGEGRVLGTKLEVLDLGCPTCLSQLVYTLSLYTLSPSPHPLSPISPSPIPPSLISVPPLPNSSSCRKKWEN
jgi:hypothetical protein